MTRREMLRRSSIGFGHLALAGLVAGEARAEFSRPQGSPLAQLPSRFAPRAKRVIFMFMHGGPSQVDTFDYKPLL